MQLKQPYADSLPYWKTSNISAESWIDKAKEELRRANGKIVTEMFASAEGKEGYMLTFSFGEDVFSIQWPVLKPSSSKEADKKSAKVQAATMLYHDIKARCVSARVLGIRSAFMGYLLMANGQTADQVSNADYMMMIPKVLMLGTGDNK